MTENQRDMRSCSEKEQHIPSRLSKSMVFQSSLVLLCCDSLLGGSISSIR
jgi:hypothetical protein